MSEKYILKNYFHGDDLAHFLDGVSGDDIPGDDCTDEEWFKWLYGDEYVHTPSPPYVMEPPPTMEYVFGEREPKTEEEIAEAVRSNELFRRKYIFVGYNPLPADGKGWKDGGENE